MTAVGPETNSALIAVIGATGTGKSKLSIQLAKALNGEVVSCDAIQVYKGLDIASNKVTSSEMQGIVHHLIDVAEPTQQLLVHDFRRLALQAIADIEKRNRVPIIAGGTFYWLESLLWNNFLASATASTSASASAAKPDSDSKSKSELKTDAKDVKAEGNQEQNAAEMYARLERVDPVMARKLHPNDVRKIARSLQVFDQTGKRHSDLIRETGGARGRGELQFANTCVIFLDCELATLDRRLDARVDAMLSAGLVREVEELYAKLAPAIPTTTTTVAAAAETKGEEGKGNGKASKTSKELKHSKDTETDREAEAEVDVEKGIWQSLGFKEFLPYLRLKFGATAASDGIDSGKPALSECLAQCVERLKSGTRRYARKQLKWIRSRLIGVESRGLTVHRVDATTLERWDERVLADALAACKLALGTNGDSPPVHSESKTPSAVSSPVTALPLDAWQKFKCDVCNRVLNGQSEKIAHFASNAHNKRKRMAAKRARAAAGRGRGAAAVREPAAASCPSASARDEHDLFGVDLAAEDIDSHSKFQFVSDLKPS